MRSLALLTAFIICSAAAAAPTIAVEKNVIRVANASRGGVVILFGVTRESANGLIRERAITRVGVDEDKDGLVTFEFPDLFPQRTVVAAIDYQTGELGYIVPEDLRSTGLQVVQEGKKKDQSGTVVEVEAEWDSVRMLILSPGKGAWVANVREGGRGDTDRARNGRLRLSFEDSQLLYGRITSPKNLDRDDVAVAIDLDQMQIHLIDGK